MFEIKHNDRRLAGLSQVRRNTLRTTLLGAVAVIGLGGAVAKTTLLAAMPAHAAEIAANGQASPGSFADLVARVSPAVVSIKVKLRESEANLADEADTGQESGVPNIPNGDPLHRFFKRDNENATHPHPRVGMALGSGFFISKDGYVVTNNHVVEHATEVELTLQNGETVPATVVGTDKKTDLALLKTKTGTDYPFVPWSDHAPRVGDWVLAVGNPFGLGGTVTAGIVSARGRDIGSGPYDDFLQIDAPVNRGNSGGPTFNTEGQVVGINTAIYSPSGGSVGIGFAIPAEEAKDVIAQIKAHGVVERGWLGLQIQPVSSDIADSMGLKDTKGALVSERMTGSPAAEAGIKAGDIVVAVDGDPVVGPRELSRHVASIGPNKKVVLTVWRDGADKTFPVTLGTLPGETHAKADMPARDDTTKLGSLGLTLAPSSGVAAQSKAGVTVAIVDEDSMAAQKGLSVGDVILEANGKAVSRPSDVVSAFAKATQAGKPILLRVKSGDAIHFVALASKSMG